MAYEIWYITYCMATVSLNVFVYNLYNCSAYSVKDCVYVIYCILLWFYIFYGKCRVTVRLY